MFDDNYRAVFAGYLVSRNQSPIHFDLPDHRNASLPVVAVFCGNPSFENSTSGPLTSAVLAFLYRQKKKKSNQKQGTSVEKTFLSRLK